MKYGCNNDLLVSTSAQPYDSPLWEALIGIFWLWIFWVLRALRTMISLQTICHLTLLTCVWLPGRPLLPHICNSFHREFVKLLFVASLSTLISTVILSFTKHTLSQVLTLPTPTYLIVVTQLGVFEPISTIFIVKSDYSLRYQNCLALEGN